MSRIAAAPVFANSMIKLWKAMGFSPCSTWNRLDKPGKYDPMRIQHFSAEPQLSISASAQRGRPIPASSFRVYGYFREDSSQRQSIKVIDDEILLLSHALSLLNRLRVWLEPPETVTRLCGSPIVRQPC